jgi:hypothetical protein
MRAAPAYVENIPICRRALIGIYTSQYMCEFKYESMNARIHRSPQTLGRMKRQDRYRGTPLQGRSGSEINPWGLYFARYTDLSSTYDVSY